MYGRVTDFQTFSRRLGATFAASSRLLITRSTCLPRFVLQNLSPRVICLSIGWPLNNSIRVPWVSVSFETDCYSNSRSERADLGVPRLHTRSSIFRRFPEAWWCDLEQSIVVDLHRELRFTPMNEPIDLVVNFFLKNFSRIETLEWQIFTAITRAICIAVR